MPEVVPDTENTSVAHVAVAWQIKRVSREHKDIEAKDIQEYARKLCEVYQIAFDHLMHVRSKLAK
jgi:hypothetical protein